MDGDIDTNESAETVADDASGDVLSVDQPANKPWILDADVFCPECDYNLRGLVSDRCPECGYEVSKLKSMESAIPWVHRKRIGWWRAYFATMWMVMFRNVEFCNEIVKPVSFSHSQSYRWATVFITWLPFTVLFECFLWLSVNPAIGSVAGWAVIGCSIFVPVFWFLFLVLATGLPSYFFHPKLLPVDVQNRSIALSYYTCGPLVLLIVPEILATVAILLDLSRPVTESLGSFLVVFFAVTLPFVCFVIWWFDLLHVAHRSLRRQLATTVKLAISIPIYWMVILFGIVIVIPMFVFFAFEVLVDSGV